ncbi:unnamed protein product [Sympodiomycopsis kandeliae]
MSSQFKNSFTAAERARREVIIPNVISLFPPTPEKKKKAHKVSSLPDLGSTFRRSSRLPRRGSFSCSHPDSLSSSCATTEVRLSASWEPTVQKPRFSTEAEALVFIEAGEFGSVASSTLLYVPDARLVELKTRILAKKAELDADKTELAVLIKERDAFLFEHSITARVEAETRRLCLDSLGSSASDADVENVYPMWHGLSNFSLKKFNFVAEGSDNLSLDLQLRWGNWISALMEKDERWIQAELTRRAQLAQAQLANDAQRHSDFCAAFKAGSVSDWMDQHRQRLLAARRIAPLECFGKKSLRC